MGNTEAIMEAITRIYDAFDKLDVAGANARISSDPQGIDEIARRWLRSREEINDYMSGLVTQLKDVHTELKDVTVKEWGDTGLVTCWVEQDYTLGEERTHVSAPTTVVLRREDDDWKIALIHSIPLPDQD
jgi:ketosteroid isomerase-like protein